MWTPECEEIPNQSERRQCKGIMAGYYRSLQSPPSTTTTVAPNGHHPATQAGDHYHPPTTAGDYPTAGTELSPLVPGLLYHAAATRP